MDWIDIIQKLAIVGLTIYTTIKGRKEWKVRKRIGSNPSRCEDMAKRMKNVEDDISIIKDDMKYIMKRM